MGHAVGSLVNELLGGITLPPLPQIIASNLWVFVRHIEILSGFLTEVDLLLPLLGLGRGGLTCGGVGVVLASDLGH